MLDLLLLGIFIVREARMGSDIAITTISYDQPYTVFWTWDEWGNGEGKKAITQSWCTDESKAGMNSDVGVYEKDQGYKVCESLER